MVGVAPVGHLKEIRARASTLLLATFRIDLEEVRVTRWTRKPSPDRSSRSIRSFTAISGSSPRTSSIKTLGAVSFARTSIRGEYNGTYWPCWPEPRPKAQRPPTRLAREVRSLGEQSSDSQGQYGPGVSASRAAIPERNRSAHLPSCVRSGLAFWASAPQKNKAKIERLDSATMSKLIAAASTERWKAGLALAGLGGLRLGEVRGLQWGDIDLAGNTISVRRSLLPDGTAKATKTEAASARSRSSPSCAACSWRGR